MTPNLDIEGLLNKWHEIDGEFRLNQIPDVLLIEAEVKRLREEVERLNRTGQAMAEKLRTERDLAESNLASFIKLLTVTEAYLAAENEPKQPMGSGYWIRQNEAYQNLRRVLDVCRGLG